MGDANAEGAAYWAARAASWLEAEALLDQVNREAGQGAMDRLAPKAGDRILDIGCGGGGTSLALARAVLPGGSVLGVDIAAAMVARSRERAAEAGLPNASFIVADAQTHDFGRGGFHGAYSRFGIMFFEDFEAAFANLRAALVPAGRLSFACWQGLAANEWMSLPADAAMAALGVSRPPPPAGGPGPFALADPQRVRAILAAAGFRAIDIDAVNDVFEVTEDQIAPRAQMGARQGAVADLLAASGGGAEATELAIAAIERALRARLAGGKVALARGALLVTALA